MTGSAGPSVNGAYEYGPFGEPIRITGTLGKANPFRWSTKFTDDETDLVYYGHRYYNPSTGRWLSRDPIGEQGGPNLYAFVRNNPISLIDLLGLDQWHHLLPKEIFEPWVLQLLGLDPNIIHQKQFGRILDDNAHSKLHPEWNRAWEDWLDAELDSGRPITINKVIVQLERMKASSEFAPFLAFGFDADVDYNTWNSPWRKRCRSLFGNRAPSASKPPSPLGTKVPSYLLFLAAASMLTDGNAQAQTFADAMKEYLRKQPRGDLAETDAAALEVVRIGGELWGTPGQLILFNELERLSIGPPLPELPNWIRR